MLFHLALSQIQYDKIVDAFYADFYIYKFRPDEPFAQPVGANESRLKRDAVFEDAHFADAMAFGAGFFLTGRYP